MSCIDPDDLWALENYNGSNKPQVGDLMLAFNDEHQFYSSRADCLDSEPGDRIYRRTESGWELVEVVRQKGKSE